MDSIDLLKNWSSDSLHKEIEHENFAKKLKIKSNVFNVLQLSIPVLSTLAIQIVQDKFIQKIISDAGFALVAVSTISINYFKFNVESVKHKQASRNYAKLKMEINSFIRTGITHVDIDLFVTKIRQDLNDLNESAPTVDCQSGGCCH